MKKVFVVESSSGSYDDFRKWIEGIFDNIEDAEKCKKSILDEVNKIKALEWPFGDRTWEEVFDFGTEKEITNLIKFEDLKSEVGDFNGCDVKEFELNKKIKK